MDYNEMRNRRFYRIAGITVQVDSELPITDDTFHPKFRLFEVAGPGRDTIFISHHFSLPDLQGRDLGEKVYDRRPWVIYRKDDSWVYLGVADVAGEGHIYQVTFFNHDYTRSRIHNEREEVFLRGGLHSLTQFPTDQILISQVLADRDGCFMHSSGVNFKDNGFLFVGHSDTGKSTMARMLGDRAEILCDDRVVVRRWDEGFRIHGSWSHGDIAEVSASSAPLTALLFLEQAKKNRVIPLGKGNGLTSKLLSCLIKPLVTADWWEKMLRLTEHIVSDVPCYILQFDKTGSAVELIEQMVVKGSDEGIV